MIRFATNPGAYVLLAAIVATSVAAWRWDRGLLERQSFKPFWVIPRREFASIVFSAFLHADLPHLLFNAFTFWAFAFPLERAIGTTAFLTLYGSGILAGDLGTYVRHRRNPGYRTLGASGAILSVLFASIVYAPTSAIVVFPVPVPIPAPVFAVCYLAFSVYAAYRQRAGINHDAHLGGAVAGIAFVAARDPAALSRALQQFGG